jgi:hypothetical protein
MRLVRKLLALAALTVVAAVFSVSSALAAIPNPYHYDTDWRQYDNGCAARAELNYWPSSNKLEMRTSVRSPYLFAGCRVNTHPVFSSQVTGSWQIFDPASPTLGLFKGMFGVDLSQLINFIDVRMTRA